MCLELHTADECKDTLIEVVSDVLERHAFMFADACPKGELESDAEVYFYATMIFEGPVCGSLGVAVPRDLCVELAANVLGVESDDPFALEGAPDALKELLNVLCGQCLSTIYGTEPVFCLSIPEVEEMGREGWEVLLGNDGVVGFNFDEAPAVVNLSLKVGGA